jgi:hypothetical protein
MEREQEAERTTQTVSASQAAQVVLFQNACEERDHDLGCSPFAGDHRSSR